MAKLKKIVDPKTNSRTKRTKYKDVIDTTTDNRVYKIALKHYREATMQISCSICRYHRGDNYNRFTYRWKKRNWKQYRKTQYKVKEYVIEYGE